MPLPKQAESAKTVTELNAWKNNAGVNQVLKQNQYLYFVWNCKKPYGNTSDFFLNWCYSSPRFVQTGNAEILCVTALEKAEESSFVPKWNIMWQCGQTPKAVTAWLLAVTPPTPVSSLLCLCQPWAPNATRFYLPTLSFGHLRALLRAPLPVVNVSFTLNCRPNDSLWDIFRFAKFKSWFVKCSNAFELLLKTTGRYLMQRVWNLFLSSSVSLPSEKKHGCRDGSWSCPTPGAPPAPRVN